MTKKEAEKAIEVLRAFIDGKEIQCASPFEKWRDCSHPDFNFGWKNYRVKPSKEKSSE